MKLDRAPYELTSMPITLQPLQFPHSRKLQTGVKLASPTAQSKVSSTQSELAYLYVEQALKLSMHAISNTMDYTDVSKVKQREDLNAAITDTQLDALRGLVVSLAIVGARRTAITAPLSIT